MPPRILIVDPEELPRMDLAIQLQEKGYQVEVAENGKEALEIHAESHPDLVITELLLGQLSGFEVSARIAADPDHACPVLYYTGFYRNESARQEVIKKYSAAGYFIKPFQLPQLKKAVASIIRTGNTNLPAARCPEKIEARDEVGQPFAEDSTELNKEALEKTEAREEVIQPLAQAQTELDREVSAEGIKATLFGPPQEEEERVDDANPGSQQSSDLEEKPIIAEPVQLQWIEPTIKRGDIDAVLTDLAFEVDAEIHKAKSDQSSARPQSSVHPPRPGLFDSDEKTLPSFRNYSAQPEQRHKSIPIFIAVVIILIGLSAIYLHQLGFSPTRLLSLARSSTGQPAPTSKVEEGDAQAGKPAPLEEKIKKPPESPYPSEETQSASPPEGEAQIPQVTEPTSSDRPSLSAETRDRDNAHNSQPSVSLVKVTEVSGQIGPPYLQRAPRMEIPANAVKTVTRPLVIRLEVNSEGKVLRSQVINESQENAALAKVVRATIPDWEFTSSVAASGRTLVKYFSAKIVPAEDPTVAGR